ncbi:MAG: enoyl-CoA hydratase [Promethearchaeota archaeon]
MIAQIKTKSEKGVLHIVLNRPKKKNALTGVMYRGIADAIAEGEKDPLIRVILLYGNGDSFCAGNDIKDFQNVQTPDNSDNLNIQERSKSNSNNLTEDKKPANPLMSTVMNAKKPIIAAVHGYAIGVGTTFLLNLDLVYAGESAKFRVPFVNLGLVPEFGSSFNLPKLVGYQKAAEIFFFGGFISAEDAHKLGIVNKVFSDKTLIKDVTALAEELAQKPPIALQKTKELIKKSTKPSLEKVAFREGIEFGKRLVSKEAQEAFKAFFEKRKPDFSKL